MEEKVEIVSDKSVEKSLNSSDLREQKLAETAKRQLKKRKQDEI